MNLYTNIKLSYSSYFLPINKIALKIENTKVEIVQHKQRQEKYFDSNHYNATV